jgi:type III pantothenate kinase
MLVGFDVGNTNIVVGVFDGSKLVHSWRMDSIANKSADEYGMMLSQLFSHANLDLKDIDDVIISTVVPSVLYTLQHLSQKYLGHKALVVGPGIKTGLTVKYDNPKQVGADRIVNAVAGLTKYGGPLIVVDLGTATTFCAMTSEWEYIGGSIAPGLKISSEALFEKTAKLPRVELEPPGKTICKNTIDSIQSGLVYGHMGMISYFIKEMKKELQDIEKTDKQVKVVATGGLARMIQQGVDCIDYVDQYLTLEGLLYIYEKNAMVRQQG